MINLKKIMTNKIFLISVIYFVVQLGLSPNYISISDEGTHVLIGLFYKDSLTNIKNFHSLNDFLNFATNYVIKYPKITAHYPPLYHLAVASILFFTSNELILRTFNIMTTLATALITYLIAVEFLKNKTQALVSLVFFLSFSSIFYYSNKIMMDIFAAFVFSLAILYYIKLRKKIKRSDITKKEVIVLSLLLALALLTKFQSIPLPIIILVDSLFFNKKLMRKCIVAVLVAGLIISPYAYLYIKFKLYKLALGIAFSVGNRMEYINVFNLFGIFIGIYVAFSVILFLWKRADRFIFFWLFISLAFLFFFSNTFARFSFIVFPVYAISCGYLFGILQKARNTKIVILVILLLALQFTYNFYSNYGEIAYPVKDLIKSIKNDGNVLIMSETPVHSSIYIAYGRIDNLNVNFIRPCALKEKISYGFLEKWGVKYIIDQENMISENMSKELGLNKIFSKNEYSFRVWETNVTKKVDCNFICTFNEKICKDEEFPRIRELISKHNVVDLGLL